MPKISIPDPQKEGATLDVELSVEQLRAIGFISEKDFTDRFSEELNRRVDAKLKTVTSEFDSKVDNLMGTEEFKKRALERWGIDPTATPGKKGKSDQELAEEISRHRKEWEAKELLPAKERLTKTEEKAKALMAKVLHGEIVQAAQGVVKPELLRPGTGGTRAPFLTMVESVFTEDAESGKFFVSDGKGGFKFATTPTAESPYMTVQDFVKGWAEDKNNAWAVVDQRQRGPGAGEPGGQRGAGGNVVLSQEEARDHAKYKAAREQAEKQGGQVIVQGMQAGQPAQ